MCKDNQLFDIFNYICTKLKKKMNNRRLSYVLFLFLISLHFNIYAQTDTIKTYEGWITASFDALDEDKISDAEEYLKNAMRLEPANPSNGLLFVNLGTIQRQQKKYKDAEISYSCAISLLEDNSIAYSSRASLFSEMEEYDKAIEDYTVILTRNDKDEEALYERALCRLMIQDTLGARIDLERIDQLNPKSAKSRLGMAQVYKVMGENAMAVELYDALIKANPKSWSLLRDRAEVYYLSRRFAAALQDINKSIEMNGKDPLSYFMRAKIRMAKNDKEYARRDLNKAIELGLPESAAIDMYNRLKK